MNQGELNLAASNGHYDTCKLIIDAAKKRKINYNMNIIGITGKPALFDAIVHSHLKCVDLIYKNGGNVNFETKEKYNIFHFIASQNDLKILEYLKDKVNLNINSKTRMMMTPLILSVINLATDMLDYLLENYKNEANQLTLLFALRLAIFKENSFLLEPFLKYNEYKVFVNQLPTKSGTDNERHIEENE